MTVIWFSSTPDQCESRRRRDFLLDCQLRCASMDLPSTREIQLESLLRSKDAQINKLNASHDF